MFCSFAKALNYIFLFISMQNEAAKKIFLAASFINHTCIYILLSITCKVWDALINVIDSGRGNYKNAINVKQINIFYWKLL